MLLMLFEFSVSEIYDKALSFLVLSYLESITISYFVYLFPLSLSSFLSLSLSLSYCLAYFGLWGFWFFLKKAPDILIYTTFFSLFHLFLFCLYYFFPCTFLLIYCLPDFPGVGSVVCYLYYLIFIDTNV